MAGGTGKKENSTKFSGEMVRTLVYILLAAVCIALFLIFGRSKPSVPTSVSPSPAPSAEPSAVPKGMPMGKFIDALRQSSMDCEIGEVCIADGGFSYPLTLSDGREGAALFLQTDDIGRVTECVLDLPYTYAGEPDSSFSDITSNAIKEEYRRREKADTALVSAFLESIYSRFGGDCGISTIDSKKIADSIVSAYYSHKSFDKKAGSARFYCETENAEDNEFLFTFRVIASFNYSK